MVDPSRQIEIQEVGVDKLPLYSGVSVAYEVKSLLELNLIDSGLGGIRLSEKEVTPSYTKDNDAYEGSSLREWPDLFDTHNLVSLLALEGTRSVGGATVAFDTPSISMLDGRVNLVVLWDIRVHPDYRGQGIGTKLFLHATNWSRNQGCSQLKIETQNMNIPARRFYTRMGCHLGEVNRSQYAGQPEVFHKILLVWYLGL